MGADKLEELLPLRNCGLELVVRLPSAAGDRLGASSERLASGLRTLVLLGISYSPNANESLHSVDGIPVRLIALNEGMTIGGAIALTPNENLAAH